MAQNIILKRSALPGKVPTTTSLNIGEVAVNTYDGKLFIKRSGSVESIEEVITTNTINTGSITLTQTGSFGEVIVSQDVNIQRDLYVGRDIVGNGSIDILGDITGSSALLSGSLIVSGSTTITDNLIVLGEVNARQFNISVISSSILFESGSSNFGNTLDDSHTFTGSVSITGSFLLNGEEVGTGGTTANTFDFNLEPIAGKIGYIADESETTQIIARTGSMDVIIDENTYLSVSPSSFNVTTGSVTTNYYHLAKYISNAGDLDFNI
jgi:hypothetical protein